MWTELLGPADAELGDLVRSGYGIDPVDFYSEALRLVQLRLGIGRLRRGPGGLSDVRARARLHPHRLLLPPARGHHGARPRAGGEPRRARSRRDHRDRATAPRAAGGRPARSRHRLGRRRARAHGRGAAALRQRLADAAHRAAARRATAAQLLRRAPVRRRAHPRALQPELLHARAVRAPREHRRRGDVPLGLHSRSRARPRAGSHARFAQPAARPHRRLRRLHRAARPLLPRVRLARHPQRHRRGSLRALARSRSPSCARAATRSSSSSADSTRATASASCSTRSASSGAAREGRVRLCVVGDGPLRRYYQSRLAPGIAESVHWAGRIDWNRPRYYASADVFCTPCQRASFGMVLLEAMSCGRPVVGSLISGFERLLHERPRRAARRARGRSERRSPPRSGTCSSPRRS